MLTQFQRRLLSTADWFTLTPNQKLNVLRDVITQLLEEHEIDEEQVALVRNKLYGTVTKVENDGPYDQSSTEREAS